MRRELRRRDPDITVESVNSVEAALARLEGGELPDVLLTDMDLKSGADGLELLTLVRERGLPMAVVVLTGKGNETLAVTALRAGADDYVVKQGDYLQQLPGVLRGAVARFRSTAARRATPMRVLYAERHDLDVELLRRELSQSAPQVRLEVVGTGDEVLARLPADEPAPFDLLLLDYQLPGRNAIELVKELRQGRRLDLPVVIITGQGDEHLAVQALRLGATDYLVKSESLLQRLPVVLESAWLRAQLERERVALHESEERFREMADRIGDTFFLLDVPSRRTLYVSPAFQRQFGWSAHWTLDGVSDWTGLVVDADRGKVQAAVEALYASSADVTLEFGLKEHPGDERARFELLLRAWPVFDAQGRLVRRAGVLQDVTERKRQDERIHRMAHYDGLTGLPNRFLLGDRLRQALAHAQRLKTEVAVLFLDLDRFKAINDTRGHLAGDQLLQQVALRLKGRLREEDTIARVGGDEFVIVLPDVTGATGAAHVADKLMEALQDPFEIDGQWLHMSGSLGVALYPRDGQDGDSLMRYADTALYQAKDGGRNGYRFFSPDMDLQAHERLRLENDLRVAIDQGAVEVHYQPQVRAADGRIVGVEALARWTHPQDGPVSPAEFIPIAEETGLIQALGEQVLERACRQGAAWLREGHAELRMAVNLSARQLSQSAQRGGLVRTVARVLAESGLPASHLVLEITESGMFEDPQAARETFDALRDLGVELAVDDFGTGYSNLAHLKRLPLSRLKIDRSLIAGLPHDADAAAIVQAVVAMARQLRLHVLCEGVETAEQREFLGLLGVDELQGWLFAKALPAAACGALLAQGLLHVPSPSPAAVQATPA